MSPQSHAQQLLVSLYRTVLRSNARRRVRPRMEPLPPRVLLSLTPVGGETAINTTVTAGNQNAPSVAVSAGGVVAYVWGTPGAALDPAVAIRDDGDYVVAFTSSNDIYAQRYNSDGTTLGSEFVVNDVTTGTQTAPAIAMDASGAFVIAWEGSGTGDTTGIYARRFNASGTALAGEFRVNTATTGNQHEAAVGMAGDGSFLVAYRDDNSGGSISGQFFNSAGAGQGQFLVSGSGNPDFPAVAANASGNFVVAFGEQVSGKSAAMYRRYNSTGGAVDSSEVQIDSAPVGNQQDESVGIDGAGNFIVAWDEDGRDGGGHGVFARGILASGAFNGPVVRVNTTTAGEQQDPAVGMNTSGGTVIAWTGAGTPDNQGIYAQQFTFANQPPVNSVPGAQTTAEDTPLTFSSAGGNAISMSDADAGTSAVQMTLSVTSGSLTLASLNGITFTTGDGIADGTMTFTGTIAAIDAAMDGLTFTPATDANGSVTLTVASNDLGNTGSGGALSDTDTVGINVTAVNDAPVNHLPPPQTVSGGGLLNLGSSFGAPLSISDVDAGSNPVQVTLTASVGTISLATTSGLTFTSGGNGDSTMTFKGTVTAINNALDGMSYSPPLLLLSNPTIDITTDDLGNTGAGGAKTDSDTLSLNSTPSNQPPVNTVPGAQTTNEDDPLVFSSSNGNAITVTDPDAGGNPVKVTLTANNGKITLNGTTGLTFTTGDGAADGTMTFTGALADVNNALSGLVFNPPPDMNGLASLQIVTDDQGNTGAGGAQTDTSAVTINVAAVNDAPINNVPASQTLLEDTPLTFSSANGNPISITDVDAGSGAMSVTLTASVGAISLSTITGLTFSVGNGSADGTMTFTGTLASINAALDGLIFTPPVNYNGGASIQIATNDQGNSGAGGPLSATDTISLSVTAVNDPPVNTVPSGATVAEDNTVSFTGGSLSIADVDVGSNTMEVTLSASDGLMSLSQTTGLTFITGDGTDDASLDFTGTLTDINAALDGLVFAPSANFNGIATINVTSNDQGASGQGGPMTDTDGFSINVTAVNDAPVLTIPAAQGTPYETDLVFNSTFSNALSIADIDAGSGQLQLTLGVTNGSLTLATTSGLAFTTGDGTADAAMTFTGTLAQINDALSGLTFSPAAAFNGTAQLSIVVDDQGNTGAGGNLTDSGSVNINVTSDIAPVLTLTSPPLAYIENDGAVAIDPALTLSDADSSTLQSATVQIVNYIAGQDSLQFTDQNGITGNFSATTGVLTLTGSATVANYQAALRTVNYENSSDNPTTTSRTIRFVANDGTLGSTPVDRVVTIAAVNDAPTSTGVADVFVHEDASPTLVDIAATVTDLDDATSSLTFAIQSNSNAALFKSVRLNAATGQLTLAYARNASGDAAFVVRVTDPHGASVDIPFTVHVSPVNDAPVLTIDTGLRIAPDVSAPIGNARLLIDDVDNSPNQLTATLAAVPSHGTLQLNGVPLAVGDTFTQQDIDDGKLTFNASAAAVAANDSLTFNVSDGAGGTLGPVTFAIVITPPGTGTPIDVPPVSPPSPVPVLTSPATPPPTDAPAASVVVDVATPILAADSTAGSGDQTSTTVAAAPVTTPPPPRTPSGGGGTGTVLTPPAPPAPAAPAPVAPAPAAPAPVVAKPQAAKVEAPPVAQPAPAAPLAAVAHAQATLNLQSKAAAQQVAFVISPGAALSKDLDTLKESINAPIKNVRMVAEAAVPATVGVTMIYLLWTIRGGYLLASLLSSMPAWRLIDPLPILDHFDDDKAQKKRRADDSDDESLESLAEGKTGSTT